MSTKVAAMEKKTAMKFVYVCVYLCLHRDFSTIDLYKIRKQLILFLPFFFSQNL